MGVRTLLAGLCKGAFATAAMFLSTSYGPVTAVGVSRDPFYPVAGRKLAAMAVTVREADWLPTPAPTEAQPLPGGERYRPRDPAPPPGRVRAGEVLLALAQD